MLLAALGAAKKEKAVLVAVAAAAPAMAGAGGSGGSTVLVRSATRVASADVAEVVVLVGVVGPRVVVELVEVVIDVSVVEEDVVVVLDVAVLDVVLDDVAVVLDVAEDAAEAVVPPETRNLHTRPGVVQVPK